MWTQGCLQNRLGRHRERRRRFRVGILWKLLKRCTIRQGCSLKLAEGVSNPCPPPIFVWQNRWRRGISGREQRNDILIPLLPN
jgi:hypothetical protein